VNCEKLRLALPGFRPQWTDRKGVQEPYDAYRAAGLTGEGLKGDRYFRITRIQRLLNRTHLDGSLHWTATAFAEKDTVPAGLN